VITSSSNLTRLRNEAAGLQNRQEFQRSQLTELASTDFESWARESYEIATKIAYRNGDGLGVRGGGSTDCTMVAAAPVLPVGYVVSASRIGDRRMILAGPLGGSADTVNSKLKENTVSSILAALLGFLPSLDQPTRPDEHLRRNCHADLLRCLEIDHQLKLRRLLHRQIGGLGSLQDSVHVICDAPVAVREVRPVGHEPTGIYSVSAVIRRR
jgi:hypothetical protein